MKHLVSSARRIVLAVGLVLTAGLVGQAAAQGTWSEKAPTPAGHYVAASAVVNDVLYIFGGADVNGATATVQAYDPAIDS